MTATRETVGVLSDTHLSGPTEPFLTLCEQHFDDCARILHAGDVVDISVLQALEARWRVEAVRGNMDQVGEVSRLPRRRLVQVGGVDVGLVHGSGGGLDMAERVIAAFGEAPPPVIIHGHTHLPEDRVVDGIRILNPGSPTDPRRAPYPCLARLTVEGGDVRFELVPLA